MGTSSAAPMLRKEISPAASLAAGPGAGALPPVSGALQAASMLAAAHPILAAPAAAASTPRRVETIASLLLLFYSWAGGMNGVRLFWKVVGSKKSGRGAV